MSRAFRLLSCLAALSLTLLPAAAAPPQQDDNLLREVQQRREVERQRVEKEVSEGRKAAYRMARLDVAGAVRKIQALEETVGEEDNGLSPARRQLILRYLRADVKYLREIANRNRMVQTAEAGRQAARVDLGQARPRLPSSGTGSPYDVASARIGSMNSRLGEARQAQAQSGDRFLTSQVQVAKAATPVSGDVEFPEDWLEKSKRRSPAQKLTDEEKALLKALKEPITVDFNGDTLASVLDTLSRKLGITLQVDKQAMEEVNVTYDTPITLRFNKPVAARTILKRILADLQMTYVIRKGSLEITSLSKAREMMVTRAYYIGDLTGIYNPFLLPGINQMLMMENINNLIGEVQSQIEPSSWESRGGQGAISFDPLTMSLIVRQSAEVHFLLGGGH